MTDNFNQTADKFYQMAKEYGGYAGLIHHIIDPRAEKDDRLRSCWIDICQETIEEYDDIDDDIVHNDYCVGCAEKMVEKIVTDHPELKEEIYINDDGVDADSSPSCVECESLITYRLIAPDFELDTFLTGDLDLCDPVCYEIYRLIEDCGHEIKKEDMRKLAIRVFAKANEM